MLTLANDQLEISILDPIKDQARLGSRYCTGGYVYAVADRRRGMITSGPGYPNEEPPPLFDGQGLPEAFPSPLWPGGEDAPARALPAPGTTMLVIGVGLVPAVPSEQIRVMPVSEFCQWRVEQAATTLRMTTRQEYAGWALELTRDLILVDRTLVSATRLTNVGGRPVSFRWFPHPFYPNPRGKCCKFNLPVKIPDNVGYALAEDGWITMKLDHAWERPGHFQAVEFEPTDRLVVLQKHPALGLVAATCSYVPSWLPIWGNPNTFSFEPYLEQVVAPGAAASWSIVYDF